MLLLRLFASADGLSYLAIGTLPAGRENGTKKSFPKCPESDDYL